MSRTRLPTAPKELLSFINSDNQTMGAAFYEGAGFLRLPDFLRLVLPMATVAKVFKM
jgi:hypothetical protein